MMKEASGDGQTTLADRVAVKKLISSAKLDLCALVQNARPCQERTAKVPPSSHSIVCLAKERIMCWCFKKLGSQHPPLLSRMHQWLLYNWILLLFFFSCAGEPWVLPVRLLQSPGVYATQQDMLSSFVGDQGMGGVFAMQLVQAADSQTSPPPHAATPTLGFNRRAQQTDPFI